MTVTEYGYRSLLSSHIQLVKNKALKCKFKSFGVPVLLYAWDKNLRKWGKRWGAIFN
jgi:hypothetical protein